MTEIILSNKKHGMLVLLLTIVLYILAVLGTIFFADEAQIAPLVLCILYLSLGWLPLLGLKVLGPQEALVLTLFGNYIGTLKGEGFYFVNPFCTAVNPAAKTQLSQSGDVDSAKGSKVLAALGGSSVSLPKEAVTKKISQDHDPQQRPAENQRLPGQSCGNRHRRHLAGGGHGEGGL